MHMSDVQFQSIFSVGSVRAVRTRELFFVATATRMFMPTQALSMTVYFSTHLASEAFFSSS